MFAVDILLVLLLIYSSQGKGNTDKSPSRPPDTNAYVTAEHGLRLRTEPNDTAAILLSIPSGGYVEVLAEDGPEQTITGQTANWYKVKFGKEIGWAWGGLIKRID